MKRIARMSKTRDVTLLYAAKDTAHNNAIVLAEALADMIS